MAELTIEGVLLKGRLYVHEGDTVEAPDITTVEKEVAVMVGGTLNAPCLSKVEGEVMVFDCASMNVPSLLSVGGELYVSKSGVLNAPVLAIIGRLSVHSEMNLDAITSVGGKSVTGAFERVHRYL